MGRSTPSFYHEKCSAPGSIATDADGKYDQPGLQKYLDDLKKYVASCWRCTDCDFRYTVTQPDGTDRTFHFLERKSIVARNSFVLLQTCISLLII